MARVVSTSKRYNFDGTTTTTTTTIMTRENFIITTTVAAIDVVAAIAAAVAKSPVDPGAATRTETGTGTGTGSRWSAYLTVEDQSQEQPVSRARRWCGVQDPRVFFIFFVFIVFGLATGGGLLLFHFFH